MHGSRMDEIGFLAGNRQGKIGGTFCGFALVFLL